MKPTPTSNEINKTNAKRCFKLFERCLQTPTVDNDMYSGTGEKRVNVGSCNNELSNCLKKYKVK